MPTCFIIQPFDNDKYDSRFEETLKPALERAGFDVYRVDKDPSVEIPIHAIEKGIQESLICLAEISTDNPNVWYELGFAFASGKSVVLICSDERSGRFPFDIHHRNVIRYRTDSEGAYVKLGNDITAGAQALLTKSLSLKQPGDINKIAPAIDVTNDEAVVLKTLAEETSIPNSTIPLYLLRDKVKESKIVGSIGFGLAVRKLTKRKYIETNDEEPDYNDERYDAVKLTSDGWEWIDHNQDSIDPYSNLPF